MFALVVSFQVKPDKRDQFLAAAEDDSICSVRDEPGCFRFDVIQDQNDPNRFTFYEVYQDDAAFQAHAQTPHFARWRAVAGEVQVDGSTVRNNGTLLFPRDYK
jgi:(4S)-4-hydroxy-5-phosphonooxypentane-2,3-dione isomerase